MTAEASIELAAEAGFDGVDLLVRDVVDSGVDPRMLRRRMEDLGLRGGGWTLPMNWKNEPEAFEADLARLPHYAEAAAVLGLLRTGTWVRFESDPCDPESLADTAARERLVRESTAWQMDRLDRIARILEEHGSRIGLEIIGSASERTGRGVPLISSYVALLRAFEGLARAHANVGVLADAYHLSASGEEVGASLGWGVSAVTWVHLADPANPERTSMRDHERLLPGEGSAGLCGTLLRALAEGGYDGPVTAEPLTQSRSFATDDPRDRASATRGSLRRVWPDRCLAD
ncbi:sugar phosphate isomerase/epimerase family protein [Paludisphaera soli]|uniref:sugar phosphate isomerase/epimerase family protein n=1 Tax=Paludisphaera soli TaxID=2712865 RepID=UPI001F110E8E|nr:sugar phosphate isomerase/epimerase family protein [Paludisphaera soli]